MFTNDKHFSLLRKPVINGQKMFCNIGTWTRGVNRSIVLAEFAAEGCDDKVGGLFAAKSPENWGFLS
jgi:hypothetical protein